MSLDMNIVLVDPKGGVQGGAWHPETAASRQIVDLVTQLTAQGDRLHGLRERVRGNMALIAHLRAQLAVLTARKGEQQ